LVVEPSRSDPVGRLGDWLTEGGLELDVVHGPASAAVSVDGYAGLVVLGGPRSAGDAEVAPVRQVLRDAVAAEVPTLAICLGAQMLALAHGGQVHRNPDGPELGAQLIAKRSAASRDPLFGPLPITPDVVQWHFDAITVLPAGAIQLASSPACEHQAFRLGRLAWGIQFHIETTTDVVRSWAEHSADQLDGYDLDLIVRRVAGIADDLVEVWRPFAHAFADIVRDPAAVKPAGTIPTSTAAPVTDPAAIRAALAAELHASRTSSHAPLPMPERRPPADD
jgi:GMP synthase-like glutamine amidotransferase